MDELQGFLWLKTLPVDTTVFTFYKNDKLFGFDKYSCDWCEEVLEFRKNAENLNVFELNNELKRLGYEYFVISGHTVKNMGLNETNQKLNELISANNYFILEHNTNDFFVFKII